MERATLDKVRSLFKQNFIGKRELASLFNEIGISIDPFIEPDIPYSMEELREYSSEGYILILGISEIKGVKLSIEKFRDFFGMNPDKFEPCFYNQDWYIKEDFFTLTLDNKWYLLKKEVINESRGINPSTLLEKKIAFPSAILCVYTFFAYFFLNREMLWCHDFIWCCDVDHNGDRIYVGKYQDVDSINRNGFSIHRHLSLRPCYAAISFCER